MRLNYREDGGVGGLPVERVDVLDQRRTFTLKNLQRGKCRLDTTENDWESQTESITLELQKEPSSAVCVRVIQLLWLHCRSDESELLFFSFLFY